MLTAKDKAAMRVVLAVGETIRELGSVPSGYLYAGLMGKMSLGQYQGIIHCLKAAKLISERGHLLTWIGTTQPEPTTDSLHPEGL